MTDTDNEKTTSLPRDSRPWYLRCSDRQYRLFMLVWWVLIFAMFFFTLWNIRETHMALKSGIAEAMQLARHAEDSARVRSVELERMLMELQQASEQARRDIEHLHSTQGQLRDILEGVDVGAAAAPAPDHFLIESMHLLRLAQYHAMIGHDPELAREALSMAHERLQGLALPGLQPVREKILEDVALLGRLNPVDIGGLSLYLQGTVSKVEQFSLKTGMLQVSEPQSDEPRKGSLLSMIWDEVAALISIQRIGTANPLLEGEKKRLRERLKQELGNARLAVLNRDTNSFRGSIDLIMALLEEHFDPTDKMVSSLQDALIRMRLLELRPPMPDPGSALDTLHELVLRSRAEMR